MGGIVSTSATGPDNGEHNEQGAGSTGGESAGVPTPVDPAQSGRPYTPPYPGYGQSNDARPGYDGGTTSPGYGQAPSPYPSAQQQGPYPQGQYQQSPYAQAPYGQGGYNQGPFGQPYAPQKSRVVAGVLGILLGSLGIHRFYLGFTTIGIIQILMSTVGAVFTFGLSAIAAGIWGLIEGIMILVGSEQFRRDAQGIPLKD